MVGGRLWIRQVGCVLGAYADRPCTVGQHGRPELYNRCRNCEDVPAGVIHHQGTPLISANSLVLGASSPRPGASRSSVPWCRTRPRRSACTGWRLSCRSGRGPPPANSGAFEAPPAPPGSAANPTAASSSNVLVRERTRHHLSADALISA